MKLLKKWWGLTLICSVLCAHPWFLPHIYSLSQHSVAQLVKNLPAKRELGRSSGEGNSYPRQYSGLENSMDCIVHGVAKNQTQLRNTHFHFHKWPCRFLILNWNGKGHDWLVLPFFQLRTLNQSVHQEGHCDRMHSSFYSDAYKTTHFLAVKLLSYL